MSPAPTARDLQNAGQKDYKAGKFAQAAELYSRAASVFHENGQAADAAEAKNNASVAYLQANNPNAALLAAEGTEAVFAASGDWRRQGIALANQAAALEGLGRLKEALARYQQAAECLKESDEKEMRALVLKNISTLQLRTGNQLQALASMDAALDNQPRLSLRERLLHKLLRVPLDMLKRR